MKDTPLTLRDAALEAGLAPSTLRWQIKNGKLQARKVGRDWVVARKELRRYLRDRAPSGRRATMPATAPTSPAAALISGESGGGSTQALRPPR